MADVISLQGEGCQSPDEEKNSHLSYAACNNSRQSQAWCWRWS
ncbi:hypothetical protein [Propioniciclava coleopterorum]|nr:hypothetical protein [Propioniciclava coleopterorum]